MRIPGVGSVNDALSPRKLLPDITALIRLLGAPEAQRIAYLALLLQHDDLIVCTTALCVLAQLDTADAAVALRENLPDHLKKCLTEIVSYVTVPSLQRGE